jgi:KAP family P-loop domain
MKKEAHATKISGTEPESSTPELEESVFRAFAHGEFLEWPSWTRLRKILSSNGGSFGISGPRGSGKSWLMLRAIEDLKHPSDGWTKPGVGLWYPSPSEYDPLSFLASLSDSLASEIERRYRRLYPARNPLGPFWTLAILLLLGAAMVALLTQIPWGISGTALMYAIAAAAILVATGLFLLVWRRTLHPERRLVREADRVRERARYTATHKESAEVGGEGGRGLVARISMSRERQLVERPATLSTLVNDFRALAEQAGEVAGRVIIAIDELDKMSDPQKVRDLLRDIKGIFEVPGVHFLVSVSDEAARTLNLGALAGRNEFNSSFYTVIELPPARPQACAELLQLRGRVPADVALALSVIAGGNPREVLRLAELVGPASTGQDAVVRALREEVTALRREIVTTDGREVTEDGKLTLRAMGQDSRIGAFNSVPDDAVESPASISVLGKGALADRMWDPAWVDEGWNDRFQEAWRRLLVRLAVAGRLADSQSIVREEDLELLQGVVVAASQSAAVGRIVLESRLQIESRRPEVEQPTARSQLEKLIRTFVPDASTEESDTFVSRARTAALDAQLKSPEIQELLKSDDPGRRVVGLAAVQATADPKSFEPVITAVEKSPPLEQYHALSALESLRPGLSDDQRGRVVNVLEASRRSLPPDSARRALAERILSGIERDSTPRAAS